MFACSLAVLTCTLLSRLGDRSQLHPLCRFTSSPLHTFLPKFGKKWFKGSVMLCSFCKRKGHTRDFCPARPYEPPVCDVIPFVESVLASPRVKTNCFIGMSLEVAAAYILKEGTRLNIGNPWVGSDKIYDRLRAHLGFWKAIGASNSVISWIGYGVPTRFVRELASLPRLPSPCL